MYKLKQSLLSIIIGLAFAAGISYAAPWIGPTTNPTGGNVAAPINVGNVTQIKKGALGVEGVFRAGSNAIFAKNVNVAGIIKIGNIADIYTPVAGTIRWSGSDFEGYDGTQWKSFTKAGALAVLTKKFTSNGIFSVPNGVTTVWISGAGGGGGGGGDSNDDGAWPAGGGGGGAAVKNRKVTGVNGNITVLVGVGGAGGSDNINGGNASPGGTSSFGIFVVLNGGKGGLGLVSGGAAGGSGGQSGQNAYKIDNSFLYHSGKGGDTIFAVGGSGVPSSKELPGNGVEGGSGGGGSAHNDTNGAHGGQGFITVKWCPPGLTPVNNNIDEGICE